MTEISSRKIAHVVHVKHGASINNFCFISSCLGNINDHARYSVAKYREYAYKVFCQPVKIQRSNMTLECYLM